MEREHDGGGSLLDRFKLDETNEKSRHWSALLDLKSSVATESDWYSTKTFQVFLDALDINAPPTIGDATKYREKKIERNQTVHQSDESLDKKSNNHGNIETILSAEALKILSELPNLSHMSSSRSFIFPQDK